jgi:hypothetical protein
MEEWARILIAHAKEHGPATVRGLYYQAEVHGVPGIDKDEPEFAKVQRQVLALRRERRLAYQDIADATRWVRKPDTYDGVATALRETARFYRKTLWRDAGEYVEIWSEKDALAGVMYPVPSIFDVPLMVSRGFSSETFCFESVESRGADQRAYRVYYLGDFDRAGHDAARTPQEKLPRFAAEKDITLAFKQLAVTKEQINDFALPTREPKRKSHVDKNWPCNVSCELDAIPPDYMHDLVQEAIERHLPAEQFAVLTQGCRGQRAGADCRARRHDRGQARSMTGVIGRPESDTLTVLTSVSGKHAAKQFSLNRKTGELKNRSYGSEKFFSVETIALSGIADLAQTLARLTAQRFAFVVRGELLPAANPKHTRRLLRRDPRTGDEATFKPAPRHWFAVDMDHVARPVLTDPRDDPECAIEYLIGQLPPELADATCWWQWTSSQSLPNHQDTLSARLWFWTFEALDDAALTRWAANANRVAGTKLIDPSLYGAVQAHYVAAPTFTGLEDPLPTRFGVRQGLDDAVSLVIPEPDAKDPEAPSGQGYEPGRGVEAYLAEIGGAKGFRAPIVSAIASYVATCGSAADPAPIKQAVRAAIERATPGGRSAAELERYASEEHLDEIFRWVKAHHGDQPPKRFHAEPPQYVVDPEIPIDEMVVGGEDYQHLIEKFNAKYAVVNEAGKAVVYEQVYDRMLARKVLIRITFSDLKKFYQNRILTVGKVTRTEANWWLDSAQRREYLGGVVFYPTGAAPANCWNLWSGFAVKPKAGDWSLMRAHMYRVICAGDNASFEYLLNWTARMFQEPHRQGEVAVVVKGLKGVGKGIFFHYLRKAWSQHGVYISNAKHLVGSFNAHLRDCVFMFADEAFFAGDRQHESVLKALITDPVLPIEGKYQNIVNVSNMLHIGMASNADWVVPASLDERRYFMLNATDQHRGDRKYFADMGGQMDFGGLAAMIHEMLNRDISSFDVGAVPETDALAEQKNLSLDTLDRWWLAVLNRGFVWRSRHGVPEFAVWQEFVATELLARSYQQWCADNRISRPMSRELLGKRMTEIYGLPRRPAAAAIIGETESAALLARQDGEVTNKDVLVERQNSARGYQVGGIEEAHVRFSDVRHTVMDPVSH